MRNQLVTVGSALFVVLAAGCGGEDSTDGSGSGGSVSGTGGATGVGGGTATGGGTNPPPDVVPTCEARTTNPAGQQILVADAAHNYTFSSTMTLAPIPVAPASILTINWSGVTQDFLGHPVDPITDIRMVMLVVWKASLEELQTKLNNDELDQKNYEVMCNVFPGDSPPPKLSAPLTEFAFNRVPLASDAAEAERIQKAYLNPEIYPPSEYSQTVMVQSDPEVLGAGTQMLQAIAPTPGETNTVVNVTSASTGLVYDADLQSALKTYVQPGVPNFAVDWSTLTVNSMGRTVDPVKIDHVTISRFDQSVSELEGDLFLDLELIPTASWSAELDSLGVGFDLSKLETTPGSGSFFPGIDETGTWLLALRCGDCRNPAPWFITVLAPCTP